MEIDALLKTIIYLISSSLFYPALFLLILASLWIIIYSGGFFAEWIQRVRLKPVEASQLADTIRTSDNLNIFPFRVKDYIQKLKQVKTRNYFKEIMIENLLQETSLNLWRKTDRLKMLVRLAPSLGLIGTLIPMGTGLAALGQGDMTKLSSDLVIAFTTTVVGLAIGMIAFFFYTIKKGWVQQDLKNIELATQILCGDDKT
ncbi:MAG: MotA/TolQ/ExbB proton channel family protein [Desulfobacula sp.]|nr:MotA/TolQ/ExbB proton channel family protein [Desulfobacula sp.]